MNSMRTIKSLSMVTVFLLLTMFHCNDDPTAPNLTNPLDRDNPQTHGNPFGLQVSLANGGVTLTWSKVEIKSLAGYAIYRTENENIGFTKLIQVEPQVNTYIDKNIQNGHSYWYKIVAFGSGNKESSQTNVASVRINLAPVIIINGGALYADIRQVNLTILANTAQQMWLSNVHDFTEGSWEIYTTAKSWLLSSGAGAKTVYMKVKFTDSTVSSISQDTIEPRPMNPSIIISDNATYTTTRQVKLKLSAAGTNLQIKISEDLAFPNQNWQPYSTDFVFLLSEGGAEKTVYAKFKNDFEVESENVNDKILPQLVKDCSVVINAGATTTNIYSVTLTLSAQYATVMLLSNREDFMGATWEPFKTTKEWNLSSNSITATSSRADSSVTYSAKVKENLVFATYGVYAKFKNDFEVETKPVYDEIELSPLAITEQSPWPTAAVGRQYQAALSATSGKFPYTWTKVGSWPTWLNLSYSGDGGTVNLTGIPDAPSTIKIKIRVADSGLPAQFTEKEITIVVNDVIDIITADIPYGTVAVTYTQNLQVIGGKQPYTWSVISGILPDGLQLIISSGNISGLPTTAGSYYFTIQVRDVNNIIASKSFTIIIYDKLQIITSNLPDGFLGTMYSYFVQIEGGKPPYAWNIVNGVLPDGLQLISSTGEIRGVPTSEIETSIVAQIKDGNNSTSMKSLTIKITNILYKDMVYVPGGTFQMGRTNGDTDERPVHAVQVDAFWISKYEVTNAQFAEFLNYFGKDTNNSGENLYHESVWGVKKNGTQWEPQVGYDNYPAVWITWYGAIEYAKWKGGRLPSEAEWEWAGRGADKSHDYVYAGSNTMDEVGWNVYNANKTYPIGIKKPNEIGLFDMSGNAWEWCQDWYIDNYYAVSPLVNPQGPTVGISRVVRGGCYYNDNNDCSTMNRGAGNPLYDPNIGGFGFRICKSAR